MENGNQLTMDHVLFAYEGEEPCSNDDIYSRVAKDAGIFPEELNKLESIGKDKRKYSKRKREIRWIQQSLKRAGYLEREGAAKWKLTHEGRKKVALHRALNGFSMLAFSTKLGVAIWGDSKDVFSKLNQPITLTISSPPYPIRYGRAYGKWNEVEIVDFIVGVLEPVVKNLVDGGSVMLNLGNDVFEPGMPSRSLYIERLTLKLYDALGLHKMDTIIWHNPSKAPGPIEWASKRKIQMATSYEPILWMCNNPINAKTDNTRILSPLSDNYKKLIEKGGEDRTSVSADGTHVVKRGNFSNKVDGSMPRNIYRKGHSCSHNNDYRKKCRENGLPVHGAMFPFSLAEHLIKFGSNPGDVVADPFGGSLVTAAAAEKHKRRFITADIMHEYVLGGSLRFSSEEVKYNPDFLKMRYLQENGLQVAV